MASLATGLPRFPAPCSEPTRAAASAPALVDDDGKLQVGFIEPSRVGLVARRRDAQLKDIPHLAQAGRESAQGILIGRAYLAVAHIYRPAKPCSCRSWWSAPLASPSSWGSAVEAQQPEK